MAKLCIHRMYHLVWWTRGPGGCAHTYAFLQLCLGSCNAETSLVSRLFRAKKSLPHYLVSEGYFSSLVDFHGRLQASALIVPIRVLNISRHCIGFVNDVGRSRQIGRHCSRVPIERSVRGDAFDSAGSPFPRVRKVSQSR